MLNYSRAASQRFAYQGMVTVLPPDKTPAGKYPLSINARAYLSDQLTPRLPQSGNLLSSALPNLIHSLRRMDDTTTQPTVPTTNGPNGVTVGTDVAAGGGAVAWSNPGNITALDGNFATVPLAASNPGPAGPNGPTNVVTSWSNPNNIKVQDGQYATSQPILSFSISTPVTVTGYGFNIPSNATILGIVVKVVRGDITGHGTLVDNTIQLHKTAGPVGQNKAKSSFWGSPPDTQTYGSSTDLWGTIWTPADINSGANGFGVFVIVNNEGNNTGTAGIDFIGITVYYSTPSGNTSDFLQGTGLGFAIGGGVQISGITVTITGLQSLTSTGTITVTLLKAGVPVGNSKPNIVLPASNSPIIVGSSTDLWGTSWSPGDINNANFGVRIQAFNGSINVVTFSVDFVQVTISGFTSSPPVNFVYISGAGTSVFVNTTSVATGMSGKRLALVPFRPNTSVAPWMYVGDSAKLIKIRSDGTTYKTGIAEPTTLPTLATSGAGPLTGFYQYAYVYRSSKTGAPSNPSPTAHSAGITTASNSVSVTCTASTDPQVDLIDIYRFGVGLLNYTYLTTILNATPQYVDNLSDVQVANNPILNFNNYEPFPSIDVPRTGTLVVSASAIAGTVTLTQASGDTFNTRWTYGTVITLSQTTSTQVTNLILFARPSSATVMIGQVQPVGATLPNGTYTFTITTPILAAQPLPALWGPTDNTAFMFGVGDPLRPGTLYFTTGNNPDSAAQTNSIEITSPAEPLIGGTIVNGLPLALSAEHGWLCYPNFAQVTATIVGVTGSPFSTVMTISDRGLVSKEAICTDGGGNVYYVAKDSIRISPGGIGSYSITDDIYNLFPHEGQPQQYYRIGGFQVVPPDYTQPDGMALRFSQGYLYFDYIGIDNNRYTLTYDAAHSSVSTASDNFVSNATWSVDVYGTVATIHADNPGMFVSSSSVPIGDLMGCSDGTIRQLSPGGTETGNMTILTPCHDAGDERATKRFGDVYFETTTPVGITGNYSLSLFSDRYSVSQAGNFSPTTIPAQSGTRVGSIIDLNSGTGIYARDLSWIISVPLTSIGSILHFWQPSTVVQPETTGERALDWDDGGAPGAKFVQGIVLQADTGNVPKNFAIQNGDNLAVVALAEVGAGVAFNGQSKQAFSVSSPFVAHVMRLLPLDTIPWRIWDVQWVFVPYPELAQEWHSERISHGLVGYQHLGDINIAHISTADITLTFIPDTGPQQVVTIPNSGGQQVKVLVIPPAFKFKLVSYNFTSTAPFRLWKEDIEVKVGQWGRPGAYQIVKPFGGNSSPGAEV